MSVLARVEGLHQGLTQRNQIPPEFPCLRGLQITKSLTLHTDRTFIVYTCKIISSIIDMLYDNQQLNLSVEAVDGCSFSGLFNKVC